jgi:hypothetical protein
VPEAEEATADKAKRGRKRKRAALEPEASEPEPSEPEPLEPSEASEPSEPKAEAPEPKAKVARICKAPVPARASVVPMSGTQVADEIVPEPWRAPVARMY